jgi:hypothetical protein
VRQPDRRYNLHVQQLCRLHASVTRDDLIAVVDKHRIAEPKPLDALGDLLDLLL